MNEIDYADLRFWIRAVGFGCLGLLMLPHLIRLMRCGPAAAFHALVMTSCPLPQPDEEEEAES